MKLSTLPPTARRGALQSLLALSAASAFCALAVLPLAAQAHGPTRQKVTETITIDAPPAKVWAVIKDFAALQAWHPAVAESASDKGNEVGAVRLVKIKGGGELVETLDAYDAAAMKYSYRAKNGGALPVTNYTSTLAVKDAGGGKALVEWRGAFYRGYPNNDPPPDQNDDAAVAAVTGVYQGGLAQIKKLAEGQ
ncbi:MAG: SRPBCC family protein [Leptothrix sp. (in: b-proteobacteria)]